MGKIIVLANQKGGVGKSTNCIQFANYLMEQGKEVFVLDCDFQRSTYDRRQDDLKTYEVSEQTKMFDIEGVELEKLGQIVNELKNVDDDVYILIDMPGKVDDAALFPLLLNANYIIVPFAYDKLTIDSTGVFLKLMEHIEVKAPLYFLPNRVKKTVKYETIEQVNKILGQYGVLCPIVHDRVDMERCNTLYITDAAKENVKEAYDFLINNLK